MRDSLDLSVGGPGSHCESGEEPGFLGGKGGGTGGDACDWCLQSDVGQVHYAHLFTMSVAL